MAGNPNLLPGVDCRWASHGSADGRLGCLHVLAAVDVCVHTLLVDVGFQLFLVFLLVSLGALGVPPDRKSVV